MNHATNTAAEREAFETWARPFYILDRTSDDKYEWQGAYIAWFAWQAARATQASAEPVKQVLAGRGEIVTCIGKGGLYQHIGVAMGAGTMRGEQDLDVYGDKATGYIYYRTRADYRERMQPVAAPSSAPSTEPAGLCAPFIGMGKEWTPEAKAALDAVLAEYPPERRKFELAPERAPSTEPVEHMSMSMCGSRDYCNGWNDCLEAVKASERAPSIDSAGEALVSLRAWFEAQRKAISKGCGSSWDMLQCDEQIALIDAAMQPQGEKA